MTTYCLNIADLQVRICFSHEDDRTGMHLLPSFAPFASEAQGQHPLLFTMTVDQEKKEATGERVKECETGNSIIVVDRLSDGGYQFLIKNVGGEVCALMQSNSDFSQCCCNVLGESEAQRSFGLNNAMMLAYAFAGARRGTLLVHASVVRHDNKGYAFIARSGTGKSTQTQNWLKSIPGCDLMNDDNPVVRVIDGEAWIYGSPWSGKTPCYRQVKAPLAAVSKIVRDSSNHLERMSPVMGFNALVSSCSVMTWDTVSYRGICDTVSAIIERKGCFALHCTADPESAVVCYNALNSDETA